MAQVHVRLDDDTKEQWQQYAETEGYDSLSRLIRKAVAQERNGQATSSNGTAETVPMPDNVATSDEIDRLGDSLLKMVDRIENMEKRLEVAEKGTLEPNDKRAVMEALPQEKPDPDTVGYEKGGEPTLEHPSAGVATDGTAKSVAAVADEPVAAVRAFLSESAHRSEDMKAEKIGGELRFWVEQ